MSCGGLLIMDYISRCSKYSLLCFMKRSMASSQAEVIGLFSYLSIAITLKSLNFLEFMYMLVCIFSFSFMFYSRCAYLIYLSSQITTYQNNNIPKKIYTKR
ncbi:unknown [Methanothermobacter phage psiM100]|uniref:hypothetical protein n=1 Tax=Methanothermobacter phage psiM100 TaxID=173824 RepID=UPI000006246F|nr:hypothetical protein psiM100p03 [Methanothermobacter phage psiM100]AAG39943.1 unknown [Methanothermobacter phage psiM100]